MVGNTSNQEETKRPKDNALYQNRMKSCQPLFTPFNVIMIFGIIGILFILIGIVIIFSSAAVFEESIIYDGIDRQLEDCHINRNNENKICTLKFTVSHDMKAPVMVFYEVHNFYQNHRQYVTSRSDSQLSGVSGLTEKDLATSCIYKLKVEGEPGRIYNPCGLAANSYFNDVFKLKNKDYILNERDIAWERDRAVYKNPPEYLVDNVTYKWLPQTYPQIHPYKVDDETSSAYYGGGVQDEHFIVWMRTSALSNFRKLYGRIQQDIPANTVIEFEVENNFEITSFEGSKALVLATSNWLGGRNPFLGYSYVVLGTLSVIFAIVFIIKQYTCPRQLGNIKMLAKND